VMRAQCNNTIGLVKWFPAGGGNDATPSVVALISLGCRWGLVVGPRVLGESAGTIRLGAGDDFHSAVGST
jgi:hypothetical protein